MSGRPVRLFDASDTYGDRYRPGFMDEPDSPLMMCNTADKHNSVYTYDDGNNNNEKVDTEYIRSLEVSQAPDTFPCGHVLCHHCIRRHLHRNYSRTLRCPVCFQIVTINTEDMEPPLSPLSPTSPKSPGYEDDAGPNVSLLSNFDEIVKKFNGVNHNLRRLKNESVQARSLGMTYTNTHCDLCNENHGTLRVVQELNQLKLTHERPTRCLSYYYRLAQGRIVTTFYSKVNSACICVPCSYKELREAKNVPELQYLTDHEAEVQPNACLAAVGKLIAKNTAPIMALKGKNVIEVDHTIRVRERADRYDFFETTDQIEKMVRQHEKSLLKMATKQIKDTGKLYHVQESNEVDITMDETDV